MRRFRKLLQRKEVAIPLGIGYFVVAAFIGGPWFALFTIGLVLLLVGARFWFSRTKRTQVIGTGVLVAGLATTGLGLAMGNNPDLFPDSDLPFKPIVARPAPFLPGSLPRSAPTHTTQPTEYQWPTPSAKKTPSPTARPAETKKPTTRPPAPQPTTQPPPPPAPPSTPAQPTTPPPPSPDPSPPPPEPSEPPPSPDPDREPDPEPEPDPERTSERGEAAGTEAAVSFSESRAS